MLKTIILAYYQKNCFATEKKFRASKEKLILFYFSFLGMTDDLRKFQKSEHKVKG